MKLLIDRNEKTHRCPACKSVFAYTEHDVRSGMIWYSVRCCACGCKIKLSSADLPKRWKKEIARLTDLRRVRDSWGYY